MLVQIIMSVVLISIIIGIHICGEDFERILGSKWDANNFVYSVKQWFSKIGTKRLISQLSLGVSVTSSVLFACKVVLALGEDGRVFKSIFYV